MEQDVDTLAAGTDEISEGEETDFDWAGLESEVAQIGFVPESATRNLVGYFRDCAVASQRGLKLLNVFDDPAAQIVPAPVDAGCAKSDH